MSGRPALRCERDPRAAALLQACTWLALVLTAGSTLGEASDEAEIGFSGNTYHYSFATVLDAPREAVHAIVTDYDRLARINDDIVESRILERYPNGDLKRVLRLKQCVLVFCFKFEFVERVTETPEAILTTIIPEESNFHDGHAEWRLEALDEQRTRLVMEATQTPDFWIPPVVGPLILKSVFLREIRESSRNIERLARAYRDAAP